MPLSINDQAPNFTLPSDTDTEISLSDYRGQNVVVYFYPKDNTPGCTKQACAFTTDLEQFNALNTAIIGISKDSVKKHQNFKAKHDIQFPLLSDEQHNVCEDYGVWKEKSMYGKTFMGIERTSFLINPDGKIIHIWNKVKVKDHIQNVLDTIKQYQ